MNTWPGSMNPSALSKSNSVWYIRSPAGKSTWDTSSSPVSASVSEVSWSFTPCARRLLLKSCWVCEVHGIVGDIRVGVEAVGHLGLRHHRVGAQECSAPRIVHAALHVHEAQLLVVLVAGKAAI